MRLGRHKATSYPVVKIGAWVGADDWAWLQRRHRYQASDVLRRLIRDYRLRCEGREAPGAEWTALDLDQL